MESQMLAIIKTNIIHILSGVDLFILHYLMCYIYPKGKSAQFTHCCFFQFSIKRMSLLKEAQPGKWDILDKETNRAKLSNTA